MEDCFDWASGPRAVIMRGIGMPHQRDRWLPLALVAAIGPPVAISGPASGIANNVALI